ncbi:MAG: DUF3048 domain-containing protein [Halanaerobium sp.]|nr:DUF3048 domain-containing protein [Halanaerobium sp.]
MRKLKYFVLSMLVISLALTAGIHLYNKEDSNVLQGEKLDWQKDMNPFTGEVLQEEELATRPLLFTIDNTSTARPQAGLKEADIIYEVPVEGGITRFLALYYGHLPERVGPIRSARPYIVQLAVENEAMLLHAGSSPGGYQLLSDLDALHLDEIYQGKYYWRENKGRKAPHNLFTGKKELAELVRILPPINFRPRFDFARTTQDEAGTALSEIKVRFWGKEIIFMSGGDGIVRKLNGQKSTGEVQVANLIVHYLPVHLIKGDREGRLEMELAGKGKALVFSNGRAIEASWQKEAGGWSEYETGSGEPVTFATGSTWIILVPENAEVSY